MEVNLLIMRKGDEYFVFLYSDDQRTETLRTLGLYAADPQLNFSWYDAAVLSKRIRETAIDYASKIPPTKEPRFPC